MKWLLHIIHSFDQRLWIKKIQWSVKTHSNISPMLQKLQYTSIYLVCGCVIHILINHPFWMTLLHTPPPKKKNAELPSSELHHQGSRQRQKCDELSIVSLGSPNVGNSIIFFPWFSDWNLHIWFSFEKFLGSHVWLSHYSPITHYIPSLKCISSPLNPTKLLNHTKPLFVEILTSCPAVFPGSPVTPKTSPPQRRHDERHIPRWENPGRSVERTRTWRSWWVMVR